MNHQTNENTQSIQPFPAFTQAVANRQIDPRRLAKLFAPFTSDLHSAGITLPDHETANGNYSDAVTSAVAMPARLPAPLRAALLTLEAAASPQNQNLMDQSIPRRIPCVAVNPECPFDRALELWFAAPDELSQFASPVPPVGPLPPAGVPVPKSEIDGQPGSVPKSEIENPESLPNQSSKIENPESLPNQNSKIETQKFPIDGCRLLDDLVAVLRRFVVLPAWAAEALALWIVHTFAFHLRDLSAYIGIESPEKRCGKTTLLTLVSQLVNRPVVASNISPPAFFRVIEEVQPTLLIDEADTFLRG